MLPLQPPAQVRPADPPSRFLPILQEFEAWTRSRQERGVPAWNPWKPAPAREETPGALVEVWGNLPPLETETQEVLRLTVAWIIAHRLDGLGYTPSEGLSVFDGTAGWAATHPGGNRIPGLVPLGWRRSR